MLLCFIQVFVLRILFIVIKDVHIYYVYFIQTLEHEWFLKKKAMCYIVVKIFVHFSKLNILKKTIEKT